MKELIKCENVAVEYSSILALRDLNLTINEGDFLGIIGPNGGGKSTLMKAILGLVPLAKGNITYPDVKRKKAEFRMGYVPQLSEFNRQFPITVFELVLTGKLPSRIQPFFQYSHLNKAETIDVLDKVGILHLKDRQISELSGGEFQKMLIARALSIHPEVLFLDEPTAMIDNIAQKQIFALLKRLSKEMTIILITHQGHLLLKQLNRLVYLNKNVIAEGDPQEVYQYFYQQPVRRSTTKSKEGGEAND